jgi:hypothetical protein
MSIQDLEFEIVSSGDTIYDPLTLVSSVVMELRVTNMGDEDLTDLGFYLVPSTDIGDVDNPSEVPAETDFQDVLSWGQAVFLGEEVAGGIKITCDPDGSGDETTYFTRAAGASGATKIPLLDLDSGDNALFSLELETPPGVPSRRLYVDLVLE